MNIDWLEVLKWIGLVLAAGFVGYFGRYLAMKLLNRTEKKKSAPASPDSNTVSGTEAKLDKKKAKAEVKRMKKAGK